MHTYLHEKHVRHIELPDVVLGAEFSTLAENFLNHGVMRLIPINACHGHHDRNIALEGLVVLFQALLDGLVVARDAGVLDLNTCMRTCLQSNVTHT